MQPSPVLSEAYDESQLQRALVQTEKLAGDLASSGSLTPRSHAKQVPANSQETASSRDSNSPAFQLSLSDVSQLTGPETNNPEISPVSSQELGSYRSPEKPKPKRPESLTLPGPTPISTASESPVETGFRGDVLSGQKRTASGQMKRSSITSIDDLKKQQSATRHARASSMLTNASNGNVVELSQQLRTRLSYAMVKVQRGWESHTLDEVESLVSQGSPRSSLSGFQRSNQILESPRTAMTGRLGRKWSSSDGSDEVSATQYPSGTINGPQSEFPNKGASRRALAPPANIISGNWRRPTRKGTLNGIHTGPFTPSRSVPNVRPNPKQRTPSQSAAMEADAVETLLFMASPGNSGYHPQATAATESSLRLTASQPSPLRPQSQFGEGPTSPRRLVEFANSLPASQQSTFHQAEGKDFDRMLDESVDDSGDDLEQAMRIVNRSAQVGTPR